MSGPGGRWVEITMADGTIRENWVPAEQPPSADGGPGEWHIVTDPHGRESTWEWHPASPALPPREPVPRARPNLYAPPVSRTLAYTGRHDEPSPHLAAPELVSGVSIGLAITSLVLGAIAVLLCWVPVVNNGVLVVAVFGLLLGAIAAPGTIDHAFANGVAIAGMLLAVLAAAGVFATQAYYGHVADSISDSFKDSFNFSDSSTP